MSLSCSQCNSESQYAILQEPLCETHANERLESLNEQISELEDEVAELKQEYNRLCERYGVNSYGEIDHQLVVEDRDDITQSDVDKVNEAESDFAGKQHELEQIKHKRDDLKQSMKNNS